MAQPTVDDLQSMFPQLPLTAIQDIVEQSGGADRAMEVLLATTDGQRPSHSPNTVPLVSMQLVNVPAAKPKSLQCVEAGRIAPKQTPNGSWLPPYLMHAHQFARHKSPARSAHKKERLSGCAAGVLGILSSMHDVKVGRFSPSRERRSMSPKCVGHKLILQPQPPRQQPHQQQQQQSSQVLLPWQQALNSNACANCTSRSPSPVALQQLSNIVLSPDKPHADPAVAAPIVNTITTGPVVDAVPTGRVSLPGTMSTPPTATAGVAAGQHLLALLTSNRKGAVGTAQDAVETQQHPVAIAPTMCVTPAVVYQQQGSGASSPTTPPSPQPPPPRQQQQPEQDCPGTPPDLAQKVGFLRGMFADLKLPDDAIERVLASAAGDVEVAVNKMLQVQASMDAGGLSEETSSQASAEEVSAEGHHERAVACLRALYPSMEPAELEGVLGAVAGELDAAVEVLADIQRQESAQLAADEELARRLHQQLEQQEAPAASMDLPVPVPTAAIRSRSSSEQLATGGRQGGFTWEQQEEQRMVACRMTLLRRMFDVQLERDMLERMLDDAGQDVPTVRDRLLAAGLPLRPGRELPNGGVTTSPVPAAEAAAATDAELCTMREAAPGAARVAIHERTQTLYNEMRARVREYMDLKRECMEAASMLFARGQRDKAEAMKLEGLRYGQLAFQENQRAHKTIYNQRNNTLKNEWNIDVHGLHIEEALKSVEDQLTTFSALPSHKRIKVITGRGAHSRGQEPKLYLAVRDFLLTHDYDFEAHLGYFVVHLLPPGVAAGRRADSTGSLPPTPGRTSPGQAPARRCRTQDDEELRLVRAPQQQLVVPLSAYMRHAN